MDNFSSPRVPGTRDDAWDKALFSAPPTISKPDTSEPKLENISFASDTVLDSSVGTQTAMPNTSQVPTIRQAKTPSLFTGHALVPLAGVLVAVFILIGGQIIAPWFMASRLAPENFSLNNFYSLFSVPATFLTDKVEQIGTDVADKSIMVAAVASVFPEAVARNITTAFSGTSEHILDTPMAVGQNIADEFSMLINQPVEPVATQALPVVSNQFLSSASLAAVGVTTSTGNILLDLGQKISLFFSQLWDTLGYYWNTVLENWQNFLFGTKPASSESATALDQEALRAQIKAEVLADLKDELAAALKANGNQPKLVTTAGGQGVVVVPATGSTSDETVKNQIKSLFSDPVLVDFDSSKQSGVITPVFKNTTGENYIFVLTPIKS